MTDDDTPDAPTTEEGAAGDHETSEPPTLGGGRDDRFVDVPDLSYETARDELASIVARLEGGSLDLEESMRLWERGEALAAHCSAWLDGAEARLADRSTGAATTPTTATTDD